MCYLWILVSFPPYLQRCDLLQLYGMMHGGKFVPIQYCCICPKSDEELDYVEMLLLHGQVKAGIPTLCLQVDLCKQNVYLHDLIAINQIEFHSKM